MVGPRKGAFAEESAEVEVLFANMEKMKGLTKKIQASKNRLETSGKVVEEAIGPIYSNTQKLQIANSSMRSAYIYTLSQADNLSDIDRVIEAIERLRAPLDQTNREESIIKRGCAFSSSTLFGYKLTITDSRRPISATT